MSTTPMAELPYAPVEAAAQAAQAPLLICLPAAHADTLAAMEPLIAAALPGRAVRVAMPDAVEGTAMSENISLVPYPPGARPHSGWALTAGDFAAAAELAGQHKAAATLVLGAESTSLSPDAVRRLAEAVLSGSVDLHVPRYQLGPHDGLLSSSILHPITEALFGIEVHLPLPIDAAFSARMAARFGMAARRSAASAETEPLLWPVSEAAVASMTVREFPAGERSLPHPGDIDINTLLADVAGSLFNDIEAKATYWQRARPVKPAPSPATNAVILSEARSAQSRDPENASPTSSAGPFSTTNLPDADDLADIQSMADSFRNAFLNLQEIWSLVLPPQSLLALKKLSRAPAEAFDMPANLWARTVYDFVLAYHLRTINRGHLLGAFTPLYLAWVASHLSRSAGDATRAAAHGEETATAFAAEKPYIVSRWRWPDRFNP